jgi:double-stranded uracil-DNA glycosylase
MALSDHSTGTDSVASEMSHQRQLGMRSFGFPPISSPSALVLVLGSLPGRLSLERGEYYANPQNAFWKIVAARIPNLPSDYASRVAALIERRIALWDVLAAATRSGSLDAAIGEDAISNNFRAFFNAHPHIQLICFNGATAARLYQRLALPTLFESQRLFYDLRLNDISGTSSVASSRSRCDHARCAPG